jgi:hypothetical protein
MAASTFAQAVEAVVDGDEAALRALLRADAGLVHARSSDPQQATLLHYVAANGVDPQRSPPNAPLIARILLEAGAEVDALAPIYDDPYNTPLCLAVTSSVPWQAGVQAKLADVFIDHGAKIEGLTGEGGPLGCALLFGYTRASERLAVRGARADNLVYAAGLGRTDLLRQMLAAGTGTAVTRRQDGRAGRFSFPIARDADVREVAMVVAAIHDRAAAVRALADAGVDPDCTPFCNQSPLHFAAHLGCHEVVDELLGRGADLGRVDTQTGKTPIEWARDGRQLDIAARLDAAAGRH